MATEARKHGGKASPVVAACANKAKDQNLKKYKQAHSIGSRKLREKFVSYNDTYPMYESVIQVYLETNKDTLMSKQDHKAKKRKHDEMKEPNNNVVVKPDKKQGKKEKTEKKIKLEKKDKMGSSCNDSNSGKNTEKSVSFANTVSKETSKTKKMKVKVKKPKKEFNVYQFMRLKREASLNASARVNIMFEKLPATPKKAKQNKEESNAQSSDKSGRDKTGPKDKSTKDKACKSVKEKDKSCKEKVEDVKKQREEIIKHRKVKIEEKKKNAKLDKNKNKIDSKGKTLKKIRKLLPKCKAKDKTTDKKSNIKKKKDKKDDLKKRMKDKMNLVGKTGKRIANLNAKALMAATKDVRPSLERAARIDRFCVSWKRVSIASKHHPVARWVDGLGSTVCCTTQASVCISKKEQQICEESKTTTTTVMTAIQKPSTIPESETISDDRPSSVVDVVGAHTPVKPLSRTPHCLTPMFSSSHNCVPPCNGFSCGSGSERFVTAGQYQSLTLGGIGSLSSIQMMSYNHQSPYRSAFSVPFNHATIPSYSYYGGGFYQPNPPVLHQSIDPCLLPHHLPVPVPHAQVKVLIHNPDNSHDCAFSSYTKHDKEIPEDAAGGNSVSKKPKGDNKSKPENPKPKKKVERRRSKSPKDDGVEKKGGSKVVPAAVQRQISSPPHSWRWSGESEMKVVPSLGDTPPVKRKSYPAIQHSSGDIIRVRDCVLLRSGPRKKDIPFVAKVSALWEHPDDNEMMMSLLWYYRPEHTEIGRKPHHVDCEVFASKHKDENSVACIDDKGYVLTFNEYCRFRAEVSRSDQHACVRSKVVPDLDGDSPILHRMPGVDVDPSTVFVCRQVYDFRQKRMLKNPS
ncbi:DNA ligase 1-like isoform X1 [Haliotis cracherodii]|uniref:DNA ligase 1-like isoform X1 n=2 Tax=Haliotis cracherodii TaxID=6455 RepID=UPI0039E81443